MSADLHKCTKPDCLRLVSAGSLYCCPECGNADRGGFELDPWKTGALPYLTHSKDCEERAAERGPWTEPYGPYDPRRYTGTTGPGGKPW